MKKNSKRNSLKTSIAISSVTVILLLIFSVIEIVQTKRFTFGTGTILAANVTILASALEAYNKTKEEA